MNLNTNILPFTNINSKWIIKLNVKLKAIKLQKHTPVKKDNLDLI